MAANDTRRLRVVVTGESGEAQQALKEVGDSADKSESKLATLTKTIGGFALKGVLGLGAIGAAAATMGFSTATNLEQVTVGFATMLGSAQKAQKFLKQLQQFANTTPFEFDDVTGAAQKFLSMGFAAKDVIPMLTAVGDAVAAMGGGAEQIDSVTTALSQMQVKGKVAGDEIMQLSEQGVPALQILADGFGVSTGQMSKMIANGDVLAKKAIPMIVKGLENGTKNVKGFGGMMQAQSGTMAGKWSTFMDTMKTGLGNLATKMLPTAKKAVDIASAGFQNFFNGLSGNGGSKGMGAGLFTLGQAITAFWKTAQGFTVDAKGLVGTFAGVGTAIRAAITAFQDGKTASDGWTGKLEGLAVGLKNLIAGFVATAGAAKNAAGWLKEHQTTAKILIGTILALVAVTKAYNIAMAISNAGGLLAMIKNLSLVSSAMKVATAVQWAYTGAINAAKWAQIAGFLSLMAIKNFAVAAATKVATAAQWLWNIAMDANPMALVVIAVAALVGAIILLWKHSDGFRNWVLGTLWPSLKKAWDQISGAFMAAINAIVAAWNWLKNGVIGVWNAVWAFMAPIVGKIVQIMTPIVSTITHIGQVLGAFYTGVWKVIWILIQVAVKIWMAYFTGVVVPAFKAVVNFIANSIKWLYNNVWKPEWDGMMFVVQKVVGFFTNTVIPAYQKSFNTLKTILNVLKAYFVARFDDIMNKIRNVYNAIAGPIGAILSRGIATFKGWLSAFKTWWNNLFTAVQGKVENVMGKIVTAFNKGRDGIKKAWEAIQNVAKAPVNFVINDVYNNRIRPLWNNLAEKFGIKTRLDTIKGFARGGVAGQGYGTQDDQLALLTRGEGILTTKEMRKLGGPSGFASFRDSLAKYNKGGVVGDVGGWLASKGKDIFQGVAGSVIKPLVSSIRGFINNHLAGGGMSGLMRSGSNSILDKLVSWVGGKDKMAGTIAGHNVMGNGSVMGWRAMLAAINAAGFNFHPSVGQTYGGGHATGSYHYQGRALDLSPPSMKAFNWIAATYGHNIKELIYGPAGGRSIKNGQPHNYSPGLLAQHFNHVHWAMDSASTVQPGWFTGYNGTGKPETLVNADKFGGSGITIENLNVYSNGNDAATMAKDIRNELIKLGRRNGGSIGLPKK